MAIFSGKEVCSTADGLGGDHEGPAALHRQFPTVTVAAATRLQYIRVILHPATSRSASWRLPLAALSLRTHRARMRTPAGEAVTRPGRGPTRKAVVPLRLPPSSESHPPRHLPC